MGNTIIEMMTQSQIKLFRNSIHILFIILVAIPLQIKAHEEPSKTLKEKKDRLQKRQQIFKSKIMTATVWKYTFEKKAETSVKHKAFVMGYDRKGNFISIEAYKNDSLTERDEYSYSLDDNMISDFDFSPNGKALEKTIYSYDEDGRVISGISTNKNDSVSGYFKILSDKDKKALDFVSYYPGDSVEYKITYKYPGNYDKFDYAEACKYDSKGNLTMKVEKSYNNAGLPIKKNIYSNDQKVSYYFLYEYDAAGNNSTITKMSASDEIVWQDHYTFDSNGNTTEMKSYDKDKNLTIQLVYEFEPFK
jgi:hypothetical protein